MLFAFGLQVILARHLSPDNYGVFVSTLAFITLIAALSNAGVPGFWLRVFGAEREHAHRWMSKSLKLLTLSLAFFIAVLWGWAFWGPHDDLNRHLLFILSPLLLGQVAIDLINAKFQVEERFHLLGIWQLMQNFLRFSLIMVLVLYFNQSVIEIEAVAFAFILAAVISFGLAYLPLRHMFQGQLNLPADQNQSALPESGSVSLKEIASESYPFALSGILYVVYFQSDIILLNYLDSGAAAGIYNIAFTVMAAVYLFPNVVYQKFLLPKLHRWKIHDPLRLETVSKLGSKLMFGVGVLIMVMLWLFVPWLIPRLFGPDYQQAVYYLNILALCAPIRFLSSSIASRLLSHSEMRMKVFCMAAVAIINVILNFLIIPVWGAAGVAVTTVISEILLLIFFYLAIKNQRGLGAEN
jgi:O-antigen/teichoic acid export membrane protein